MAYEAYIASPAWQALRRTALIRDGERCRLCKAGDDLEVHHPRYPPRKQWSLDGLWEIEIASDHAAGRSQERRPRLPHAEPQYRCDEFSYSVLSVGEASACMC